MGAREEYDAYAHTYDQQYLASPYQQENARLRDILRDQGFDLPILDVGCGTGLLLDLYPCEPDDYLGIDISPGMVLQARQKRPSHLFKVADLDAYPASVPGRCRAVVSIFGPYSYAKDPQAAIDAMYTALKPGGKFLIMLYSTTYHDYPEAQNPGLQPKLYTAKAALPLFHRFESVRIAGFGLVSIWRKDDPPIIGRFRRWVGKRFPHVMPYLIVTGRKADAQR